MYRTGYDLMPQPARIGHTYARGRGQAQMIPDWPYSFLAALEPGAASWTVLLDATRLYPDDDATAVTAAQLQAVVTDAGYDVAALAWLLADLPVTIVGRPRSDRVFYAPVGARAGPTKGRPPRHGARLALRDATTHPQPTVATVNDHYGRAEATAFARMHPKLDTRRSAWAEHPGPAAIIEGSIVGLTVERLPGDRYRKPVWLWASKPVPDSDAEVDHWWSMFISRFDLEHTFRFLKQSLGWTQPRLRNPEAADRWTWMIFAAYTQLRPARPLTANRRLRWQKPLPPDKLTPTGVRAGYRCICQTAIHAAAAPKASRADPGRPRGRPNKHKAPMQPRRQSSLGLKQQA